MRRREFIVLFGGGAAIWPVAVLAQRSTDRMRRVGILMPFAQNDVETRTRVQILKQELQRLGWIEDRNVKFDERWTTPDLDRIRANAASLVEEKSDVIVAVGGRVIPILMQLTQDIPIVIPGFPDPVLRGLVHNIARPGGNVTGFAVSESSTTSKALEILKQLAPGRVRAALVYNPDDPGGTLSIPPFESYARSLGFEPVVYPIHDLEGIERAISSLADQGSSVAYFTSDLTIVMLRDQVLAILARQKVPAIFDARAMVANGGLASYGADRTDLFRRAAPYVDRILRGEKSGDLPFQLPTKYELVINRRTAGALGLDIPVDLLTLADEVIE